MKIKKEFWLRLAVVLVVALIIGLIIYKFAGKKENIETGVNESEPGITYPAEEEINSFENKLREIIDSVNYANQVFNSTDYSADIAYQNELSSGCYKFTGENKDMYINVIETIYENPFSKESYFYKETLPDESGEDLYICKPNSCSVKEIAINEVEIVNDKSDDEKTIKVDQNEYMMKKVDEAWKLNKPIISCE